MNWANYNEVLHQMRDFGLVVGSIDTGKMQRCKVENDHERRGWYMLHDLRLDDGDNVLVGSFGRWQGNDNNAQKIDLSSRKLSDDQRAVLKKRIADDKKRVDAERQRMADEAAKQAKTRWDELLPVGSCQYLESKSVQAHGLRFSELGEAFVPMLDGNGKLHGLQILLPKDHPRIKETGRNKDFWPAGLIKKGHWHQLGAVRDVVLIAEGYATAASIFEATGLPVAVAFDAGNLLPVAEAIKKRYRNAKVLICADDDFKSEGNPGMSAASAAALAVGGAVIAPVFTIDREVGKKGLTDFNDLHLGEGLHAVRAQIESKISQLAWVAVVAKPSAGVTSQGGGERGTLKSMLTIDEALDRFALVFGGNGTMFDFQEHILVPKNDVLDILPEHGWRDMRASKKVVRMDEVGFDPAGTDKRITCNLYGGWPTVPKQGSCDNLLELLEYLCSEEENYRAAFEWVLKWIAYPIQHPGAKMRTALIFHGPQGTGKNLIFESIMAIYGEYGRIVDQSAVEDKFNDWASKKLFMIADEVVARQELFHVKNKLKGFVTGEWIRINPKNVAAHDERNHVNLVFLSNESQPLVLDKDDRRYAVIHTPEKLTPEFYQAVRNELNAGGIEALHYHLLTIDLGDFDEHTKPPMTKAKRDLIDVSMDSVQQFIDEWVAGRLELPVCPAGSAEFYEAYCWFCRVNGESRPRPSKNFIGTVRHMPRWTYAEENRFIGSKKIVRGTVTPPLDVLEKNQNAKSDSETKAKWLTDCCEKFAEALELLK